MSLLTASSCTLFVDTTDLANAVSPGADAAPDADAAASNVDGGGDAAATDAAEFTDGASTRFCAEQGSLHSFCADFDEPGAPVTKAWDASWTQVDITGGSVTIDPTTAKSLPASLSTILDPNPGGTTFHADLSRSFGPPAPSRIRCAFDFRFDRGVGAGSIGAFDLVLDNFGFELAVASDGTLQLFDSTPHSAGAIVRGDWTHIEIVLERTTPSMSVSLNGQVFLQYAPQGLPSNPAVGRFMIGMEAETGQQQGWQFHYDNLTCDL